MTEPQSDQIQELNINSGQVVRTIDFNTAIFGITLTENDKMAWITEPFKGAVVEINLTNNKLAPRSAGQN